MEFTTNTTTSGNMSILRAAKAENCLEKQQLQKYGLSIFFLNKLNKYVNQKANLPGCC